MERPFPQPAGAPLRGMSPLRMIRRGVVLAFAVVQLFLVARILLDVGVIPAEGGLSGLIVAGSDALAAPVQGVGNGFVFGGAGGLGGVAGDGFNPVMMAALAGWTFIEGLVMRVVTRLAPA